MNEVIVDGTRYVPFDDLLKDLEETGHKEVAALLKEKERRS
jgi:hypothetical protein